MRRGAWLLLFALVNVDGFYLPGVAPVEYFAEDPVELKVNKITSTETQLPYEYYDLPFCEPAEGIKNTAENLGEVLSGDRIHNSPYKLNFGHAVDCAVLCSRAYSDEQAQLFATRVKEDYRMHWILDNLPAATHSWLTMEDGTEKEIYEDGFPLGFVGDGGPGTENDDPPPMYPKSTKGVAYLHNHVAITVKYHQDPSFNGARIVGFEVNPTSIQHAVSMENRPCADLTGGYLAIEKGSTVVWTYSVKWEDSAIRWASRWDTYLLMNDAKIHWFSIVNSLIIVLFLSGMVAMIMLRTLHQDLRRYNELRTAEEVQEETGWKLVHGDVFRPPVNPMALAVLVGDGVQVFAMAVITLIFALLGFLSPANRGGLLTAVLVLFILMGAFAGYNAARLYKMMGGKAWKRMTILTATVLPGVMFGVFFILNFFIWGEKSSGAVPFSTLCLLMGMWFGVSTPLVFLGSYFGNKKKQIDPPGNPPLRVNQIPRQVPPQVWYMRPLVSVLMAGVLPFGAVFIELFFILSSIWLNQFYYIFGFLFIVFVILVLTCAEITIVMTYFQLCSEDYHWWWRSFFTSAASALYMFLYSAFYFFTKLHIHKFVSGLLFFGYTFILSFAFFCMTGAVGFYATLWFVRKIYGSIKVS